MGGKRSSLKPHSQYSPMTYGETSGWGAESAGWSKQRFLQERTGWLRTTFRTRIWGEFVFFKLRLRWISKQYKSPLAVSYWRWFGKSEGRQQGAPIRQETYLVQEDIGVNGEKTTTTAQKSPLTRSLRDYRSTGNNEERRRPRKISNLILANDE